MKINQYIFPSLLLVLTISSCCDEKLPNEIIEECSTLVDSRVVDDEEKAQLCIYNDVYRYEGKIYTICHCCVCDKEIIPMDCEGNLLCELGESCLVEFLADAEFLFSVTDE